MARTVRVTARVPKLLGSSPWTRKEAERVRAKLRKGEIIEIGQQLIIQFDVNASDIVVESFDGKDQIEDRGIAELSRAMLTIKGYGDVNAAIGDKPPTHLRPQRPSRKPRET